MVNSDLIFLLKYNSKNKMLENAYMVLARCLIKKMLIHIYMYVRICPYVIIVKTITEFKFSCPPNLTTFRFKILVGEDQYAMNYLSRSDGPSLTGYRLR